MLKGISGIVIGIVFLAAAIVAACSTVNFIQSSILVQGRVVKLNAGGSHPEIEFLARDGKKISYPQGGTIFGMRVGDDVQVRYLPDAPRASATVNRFGALWDKVIFFAFMALVFSLFGFLNLPPPRT